MGNSGGMLVILSFVALMLGQTNDAVAGKKGFLGMFLRGAAIGAGSAVGSQKSYGAGTLRPPELRACVVKSISLDDAETRLNNEYRDLQNDEVRLKRISTELDFKRALVNEYSQESVDDYNRHVARYKAEQASFNSNADKFNSANQQFQLSADSFNGECGGKRYYEDDLREIELALGISLKN